MDLEKFPVGVNRTIFGLRDFGSWPEILGMWKKIGEKIRKRRGILGWIGYINADFRGEVILKSILRPFSLGGNPFYGIF